MNVSLHPIGLQESRQKRDTFLNQMSSFLEGIESNTTATVVPPESYTAAAFPPSAESTPSTSVFPESTSSLMKEEDLFGERLSEVLQYLAYVYPAVMRGMDERVLHTVFVYLFSMHFKG